MANQEEKYFIVDGYLFQTEKEARMAEKELACVEFLQKNNNLKNPKVILEVYHKILEQGLFQTPVGIHYLKQLQNTILSRKIVEKLEPIPVKSDVKEAKTTIQEKNRMLNLDDVGGVYKRKYRICLGIIGVLLICVIGMFVIASTTEHPTIINYEEKLINKYEQWEMELKERENNIPD